MKRFVLFICVLLIGCSNVTYRNLDDDFFEGLSDQDQLRSISVYFDGKTLSQSFYESSEEEKYNTYSVTKSITSLLIGIAIDQGYIQSEEDFISMYLPVENYSDDIRLSQMTIRDVLTMQSGFDYMLPCDQSTSSDDALGHILSHGLSHQPGEHFHYTSYTANLATLLLNEVTGDTPLEFANKNLFGPLEISDVYWESYENGVQYGSSGCYLSVQDMMKIGHLMMDKGLYDGKRIVSESWVNRSVYTHVLETDESPLSHQYGYLWWLGRVDNVDVISAIGYGGQYITIIPERRIIITTLSATEGAELEVSEHILFMSNYIENDLIINLK